MSNNDEASFNPRSWAVSEDPRVHAAPVFAAQPHSDHDKRRLLIACFASASLILSGTVIAWLNRERETGGPSASSSEHIAARPLQQDGEPGISERTVNLASLAGLHNALIANGISSGEADTAVRAILDIVGGRPGEIRAAFWLTQMGKITRLARLDVSFADSSGAIVTAAPGDRFIARSVAPSLDTRIINVRGEMNDTDFYSSAVAAGVTDSLISTFAQAFVYDFNFQTEIKAGDVFEAVFEQKVNDSGQDVGPPRLLFASMITSEKAKQVYYYRPAGEKEGWFDGNGRSIRRSFMRTPVDGARITSHFGMRFHPVLHYTRLHGGTDFAAPVGTPIYATAGGTVEIAKPSSCAGNMVIIRHDNGWETAYFHMDHYAVDIHAGERVEQGHELGVVGTTGVCTTGPHLHYEVHIDGEKVDPESIPTEQGEALKGDSLKAFFKERDRIDVARVRYAD